MKQRATEPDESKSAGASLKRAAREEEHRIETRKGSDLAKGAKRFDERSKSSDGKSAEEKQRQPRKLR